MEILKILFIILLIIFPLNQLARLQVEGEVAITAIDVAVGLTIAIWILRAFGRKNLHRYILSNPIFIFIAVCFLSLVANSVWFKSDEVLVSSLYILRWLIYACLYFVVKDFSVSFKKNVVFLLVFIGAIIVVGGYAQYFLYPDLRNLYYLGWDEHLYRMFSSFLDPNFAGTFFVLYFLLLLGLIFDYRLYKKRHILFLSSLGAITLIAIFLTYSRSALIMLVSGSFCLFVLKKQKRLIFLLLGLIAIFFIVGSKNFYIENLNLFRIASSKARLESASHSLAIILDNPILGVGFNAYRYAQVRYGFIQGDRNMFNHSGAGTDNSFLFVLATTGVVGFTFYLYMWLKILKVSNDTLKASARNNFQKTVASVLIASTVGIFVNAFFINSLFYPSIMLWMWILIGLTEST